MIKLPKISIITPTLNAGKTIEACILSVLKQTYLNKEHIIIDGVSTDETLGIVKKYTDIYTYIKWISEKDKGIYDAMNKGIDLSSGEWIYFLGADDFFYSDSVLDDIFNIEDISNYDVIYGNVQWGNTEQLYDGPFSRLKLLKKNICHQAIFTRKSVFDRVGKFDTNYMILADWVFNMKWFNMKDIRHCYISKVVANYGREGISSNNYDLYFLQNKESIIETHFPEGYKIISSMIGQLEEKDQKIANLDQKIAVIEDILTSLFTSRSWRVTRPLRQIDAVIRKLRYLIVASAQRIYDATPLPQPIKIKITNFVFTYFGIFFKGTDRYEQWLDTINCGIATDQMNIEPIETYYEKVPDSVDKITGITFSNPDAPIVSIIIPVFNNWRYTYACLQAIRERSGDDIPYEVIIADDSSTDDTRIMLDSIKGIHITLNKRNLGFLQNCNNAATHTRGRYIILLNNDTEVQGGWLEPLVKILELFDDVGMVGSKLLYQNGQLQEAGSIIWNDGSGYNFGRGDNPKKPEYNFVREVDYCSGACILIRKELWSKLGGFDEQFMPAYCEDSDFALQIREAGYKVFYQPESRVVHFEGISSGTDLDSGVKRHQPINQEKLARKWEVTLKTHSAGSKELFLSRDRSQSKKIILVIDDKVPEYDQHAGGLTTYQYVRLFCDMGFKVIFLADNLYPLAPYTAELQQLGVEVIYGDIDIKEWLARYGKYLHYAWLTRPDIASKHIDLLKKSTSSKILYFTCDLHYLRERRRYRFDQNTLHLDESKRLKKLEFDLFSRVDVILTPSNYEERVIKENFPHKNVFTIPLHFYEFPPENDKPGVDFSQREGILFLGGFNHPPNVDAVIWFVKEILPRVREQLPEVTFTVAGSNPSQEILALQNEGLRVTGYVPDLRPLFEKTRVFVAPLRYGAGVKGKIVSSMVYGVPVVTTSIGNEGINLADGQEVLIADEPEAFAARTVELYTNQVLWERLAHDAQTYVRHHFSTEKARQLIQTVMLQGARHLD